MILTPRLPPEGSFERFLVDLQVDLRVALTRPDDDLNLKSSIVTPWNRNPSMQARLTAMIILRRLHWRPLLVLA